MEKLIMDSDYSKRYQEKYRDNDLVMTVSAFTDFTRMRSALFNMEGDFDEAVEDFDFIEWSVGGHDKDIQRADYRIRMATKALEKLEAKSWKRVCKIVRNLPGETFSALFGENVTWNASFEKGLYEFFLEGETFPYPIDEAFVNFVKTVREYNDWLCNNGA